MPFSGDYEPNHSLFCVIISNSSNVYPDFPVLNSIKLQYRYRAMMTLIKVQLIKFPCCSSLICEVRKDEGCVLPCDVLTPIICLSQYLKMRFGRGMQLLGSIQFILATVGTSVSHFIAPEQNVTH